jgi:hypothetical protein
MLLFYDPSQSDNKEIWIRETTDLKQAQENSNGVTRETVSSVSGAVVQRVCC